MDEKYKSSQKINYQNRFDYEIRHKKRAGLKKGGFIKKKRLFSRTTYLFC